VGCVCGVEGKVGEGSVEVDVGAGSVEGEVVPFIVRQQFKGPKALEAYVTEELGRREEEVGGVGGW